MNIEFLDLIRPFTGHISNTQSTAEGGRWSTTFSIECEKGTFFIKAVPNRPGGLRDSILREGAINPFVHPVSPKLQWQVENDEWIVLGFDWTQGRSSDFSPGSLDLPKIIDVMNQISEIPVPEIAYDWKETRWDAFTPEDNLELLRGSDLLYVDIQPHNILIGSSQTWAIDWGWPTKGAGFIPPSCLAVQLISGGHSPESAESWACQCLAWKNANPVAIDEFSRSNARMQRYLADRFPEELWMAEMATASEKWADHRNSG